MELQVGVKVLLKNPDGKFLLMRRSATSDAAGKWDMPGGRINIGDSLEDNLSREIMEETGLTLKGKTLLIAAQDILATHIDKHIVRLTYLGSTEGEPRLSNEHTDYKWFTRDEMSTLELLDTYLMKLIGAGII